MPGQASGAGPHPDPRRFEFSPQACPGRVDPAARQASLAAVEAVGRHYRTVPPEIASCAMQVVGAVDRATGNRRR